MVSSLAPGAAVDRYIVLSTVGQGGMGVVYAAYDPVLDRKIALKLIRPELVDSSHGDTLRERLLREAQAMARLSHPNVAAIYDVGAMASHVFIAMEFVRGETIRAWLQRPRTLHDVLALFLAAGRGLAAAHAMGIVHRDFKPENVLCGPDGRVVVTDFGLAHRTTPGTALLPGEGGEITTPPGSDSITRASTVVGTPAYMAPEARAGSTADARSDQYSFAVSLYEALHGTRPSPPLEPRFPHRPALAGARAIPPQLRAALRTALAADPARRFSDMDALLRAISSSMRSRRRMAIALAAVAVGAVSVGLNITGALHRQPSPLDACLSGRAAAGEIWNPAASAAMTQAFLATALPFAGDAARATRTGLDRFFSAWSDTYTGVCDASWRLGEQPTALLDARLNCLRRRKDSAAELIALLSAADRNTVQKAHDLVDALAREDCRSARLDPQRAALPPPQLVRVEAIERALDGVRRQVALGDYPAARRVVDPLVTDAQALGVHRLVARALWERGWLEQALGDYAAAEATLTQMAWHASAGDAPDLELTATAELANVVGYWRSRFDDADRILPRATALAARLAEPPELAFYVATTQGNLDTRRGKYDLALAAFDRGVSLVRRAFGPDSANEARLLGASGTSLEKLGRYPEARSRYEAALAIQQRALGQDHPDLAESHLNLGVVSTIEKQFDVARVHLDTARRLLVPVLGDHHVRIADILEQTAISYQEQDRDQEAIPYHEQAIAIAERQLGRDALLVAHYLSNYALILTHLRRFDEAQRMLERVLAVETKQLDADHPDRAVTLLSLGQLMHARGKLQVALPFARQAREMLERRLGKDHPDTREARQTEDEIVAALQRPAR